MTTYKTVKCPMQKGQPVSLEWCDYAQFDEVCEGCTVFPNRETREVSKYQKERYGNNSLIHAVDSDS